MIRAITVTLPWPPSVNSLFPTLRSGPMAGRRVLSKRGRSYNKAVADVVMAEQVPRFALTGKLSCRIEAFPPDRRRRDLDNFKAVLDCLQKSGVIREDSDVDELTVVRKEVFKGGKIIVTLAEAVPVI